MVIVNYIVDICNALPEKINSKELVQLDDVQLIFVPVYLLNGISYS